MCAWGVLTDPPLCECGCGGTVTVREGRKWRRFITNHHQRLQGGQNSPRWTGGTTRTSGGYVLMKMPNHPRAQKSGYVRRCIIVAEEKLGRSLVEGEVVHHINERRDDDRPENISVLSSQSAHVALHNAGFPRACKLTDDQVSQVLRLLAQGQSGRSIAKLFGVGRSVIHNIAARRGLRYSTIAVTSSEDHAHP